MALLLFAGFGVIYLLIPWLIARLCRDMLRAVFGRCHPALTFLAFCGAFALVWTLRSDPTFWFHADQLEKFAAH